MNFGAQFGIAMLASASAGSGLDISNLQLDSAYLFKDGPIPAHAVGCDQDGRLSGG